MAELSPAGYVVKYFDLRLASAIADFAAEQEDPYFPTTTSRVSASPNKEVLVVTTSLSMGLNYGDCRSHVGGGLNLVISWAEKYFNEGLDRVELKWEPTRASRGHTVP